MAEFLAFVMAVFKLIGVEKLVQRMLPLDSWLDNPVRQAKKKLENRYFEFARRGIDRHRLTRLLDDAKARLERHALHWPTLADDRLDPATIADRILAHDPPREEDRELLAEMLSHLFESFLSHPKAIEQATPHFHRAMLNRTAAAVLVAPQPRPVTPEREAAMLDAEAELVPLVGRDQILKEILKWCMPGPHAASVRLFTGPGGTGKTRLFREVCRSLPQDWAAGFLNAEHPESDAFWSALTEARPVLVVVDYADYLEGKPALEALLSFAHRRPLGAKPLRIALVTRGGGDWWNRFRRERPCAALEEQDLPLPIVQSSAERTTIYRAARSAFAQATGKPEPDTEPDLGEPHFERPLFLLIQALLDVQGDTGTGTGKRELLGRIMARERNQIIRLLGQDLMRAAVQLEALVTLAGGVEEDAARSLAKATPLLGGQPDTIVDNVISILRARYPGPYWLNGITPDLLGERLVIEEVDNSHRWKAALGELMGVLVDYRRFVERVAAILTHGTATGPLSCLLAEVVGTLDPNRADALLRFVPLDVPALRSFALQATQLIVQKVRSTEADEQVAFWLGQLRKRHMALGNRREALEAVNEETAILRRLTMEVEGAAI